MLLLLLVVISAFCYYLWCQRKFYILSWKIRGPLGLPFVGISWKIKSPEDLMRTICELKLTYKSPLTFWLGTKCMLYVDDPIMLQEVLNAKECSNKSELFDSIKSVLGESILTSKYDKWQRFKRLFSSCFSHNTLLTFFEVFNNSAGKLTKRLDEVAERNPIDVRQVIKASILDTALQTVCGKDMTFTEKDHTDLLVAVTRQVELCVDRMAYPWLLIEWIYRLTNSHKLQVKYNQLFMSVLNKIIVSKLEKRLDEEKDFQDNNSGIYLDKALDLEKNGYLTKEELNNNTLTFMVTSFETSQAHIFLTLLCLAMYPEYQEKLIEELGENLPADPNSEITYENIKDLKYLDMVFNESLRLMPAVPLTVREVTSDFKLQNGVTIPQGAQILINVFNAQRNKEIWGEKAQEFYPDHFLPENLSTLHPYAYVPFLKGVRTCIGFKYAAFMSKVFLCRIFRKYRVTTKTKMEDLQYVEDISLKVKNPCLIEVTKIQNK